MAVIDLEDVLAKARSASLTRDNPLLADLPSWFSGFRDAQRVAIREIMTAYEEGAKCVVLDAPTGSGKTLIGETVRRMLPGNRQSTYVCSSKALQDQFCVAPKTRILTANLSYKRADELVVGEELVAFDEERSPNRRMWRRSTVEATEIIQQPCWDLEFEDGTQITCSGDHMWLTNPQQVVKWTPTTSLRVAGVNSTKVCRILDSWEEDKSWGAGYLAAAFDGEGHLHQRPAPRGTGYDVNLSFAQKDNEMLTEVRKLLDEKGFPYALHWDKTGCSRLVISGRRETMRFLGEIRPKRLLSKFDPDRMGMMNPALPCALTKMTFVGIRDVVAIKTTTGTYVAEGLASHNCNDYPYARVLKGRSNYPTVLYPERFGGKDGLSCADCTKSPGDSASCMWCPDTAACLYEQAKSGALRADLAVLNTSYFLSECNGPGRFSRGGFVIADEADTLESELMGHVEVRISERRLKQYGLGVPKFVTKEESWIEWTREAVEKVSRHPVQRGQDLASIREASRHTRILDKLRLLNQELPAGNWVFTGDRQAVAFKPVTVSALGQVKLWQHGDKWLLMSATVISADELLESLGWDEDKDWRLVKCPSTFKPENRKVTVWPVASMTHKTRDESIPVMVDAVVEIAKQHPDDRILVHSTSYSLTNEVVGGLRVAYGVPGKNHLSRPVITYTESHGKDYALAEYLSVPGAILVAPSLDRGIDLPGDQCRVQVICKVPYLSIADKQVSKRLYGTGRSGKTWYAVNAIRTIIQMCGRAVRSENDYCVTYILDRQFVQSLYAGYRNLVPEWFKEALVWRKVK